MKNLILLAVVFALSATADTLTLRNQKLQGVFNGFARGKITFQAVNEDKAATYPIGDVQKLKIDPPLKVSLYLSSSKKTATPATLRGYGKNKFSFVIGEEKKQFHYNMLEKIDTGNDIASYMKRMEAAKNSEPQETDGKPASVKSLLQLGKVNIVHFHVEDSAGSTRQGNLAERIAKDSHNRVVYHQITVSGPDDPICAKYKLTSLPQFWIYDRSGKVSKKLDERFDERDIATAVKAAK